MSRHRVGVDDSRDRIGRIVEAVHELEAERNQQRNAEKQERQKSLDGHARLDDVGLQAVRGEQETGREQSTKQNDHNPLGLGIQARPGSLFNMTYGGVDHCFPHHSAPGSRGYLSPSDDKQMTAATRSGAALNQARAGAPWSLTSTTRCTRSPENSWPRLVRNLLDHAERRGAPPIEVLVRLRGGKTVIGVTDHAIGVEPRDREHVFTPFYRTEWSNGPGAGLVLPWSD